MCSISDFQLTIFNSDPTEIPIGLPDITELYIEHCPNITEIPFYPHLTALYVIDCPNIKKIRYSTQDGCPTQNSFLNLEKLYIEHCPNITEIPVLDSLKYLNCSNCDSLTELVINKELEYLDCTNCPILKKISVKGDLCNLRILRCSDCPLLSEIPSNKDMSIFGTNSNLLPINKKIRMTQVLTGIIYTIMIGIGMYYSN